MKFWVAAFLLIEKKGGQKNGIVKTEWEAFDEHPDLIHFEGNLARTNEAYLERRK